MAVPSPAKKNKASDMKIMLVDDDDSILQMIRASLEGEGFQVRTGRDARNFLKKAVDYKPDLIVTDLMMPGGGGYELLRSLQSDDITRKIPVLLMTGYSMDNSTKTMMQQEPNLAGYFEKPLRPEKLIRKVHEVLNTMSLEEEMMAKRSQQNDMGSFGGGIL
jgi:CheY-like chemotaxis protein